MTWAPPPKEITVTLTFPDPEPVTLDPARTALVIVDMENYFCKRGNQRMFDVIEPIRQLLEKARGAGVKVIFVHSVRSADAIEFSVFGRTPYIVEGTEDAAIVDELTPLPH